MADRTVALTVTDDVGPGELARVLPEFLAHAASLADRPTEAVFSVASRDVDRARVTRAAGLQPSDVLAVADLSRTTQPAAAPAGVTVRDADPADAAVLAELWIEQAEYEARVGTLRVSDAIRVAIAAAATRAIAGDATVLLAESDGSVGAVLGAVVAESTTGSAWAGTRLRLEPVSYLSMASTAASARGAGVGAALVAELHRRHRADGLAASVLHYGAVNPLSVPFWSQRGYRPLVTTHSAPIG